MADNGAQDPAPSLIRDTTESLVHLEQRVRRLEDAVVQLQDTRPLEERVVERVTARVRVSAAHDGPPAAVPVAEAPPQAVPVLPVVTAPPMRPLGLLRETLAELRSMIAMYVDRRYRMTWTGRLLPAVLLGLLMLSLYWFPGLLLVYSVSPTLSMLLDKIVDLVLAYILFKLLAWEAKRYREAIGALPHY
jgi:hypothetical protein